jgi:hypothetical protein
MSREPLIQRVNAITWMQLMIEVDIGQQKCHTEKKSGLCLPKLGRLAPDSFMTNDYYHLLGSSYGCGFSFQPCNP